MTETSSTDIVPLEDVEPSELSLTVHGGDDGTVMIRLEHPSWPLADCPMGTSIDIGGALSALARKIQPMQPTDGHVWPHDGAGPSDDPPGEGST